MTVSKRDFMRMTAGAGAGVVLNQLTQSASVAQSTSSFRAMVGIFLFGGSDNWNMIVPTDSRYSAYATGRGASLALPQAALTPLPGVPFGLHPSLAPLSQAWSEGALSAVLNVGSLYQPLTKALYQSTPADVPLNLMSHADEQNHWQGLRMRDVNTDGFMGRQKRQGSRPGHPGSDLLRRLDSGVDWRFLVAVDFAVHGHDRAQRLQRHRDGRADSGPPSGLDRVRRRHGGWVDDAIDGSRHRCRLYAGDNRQRNPDRHVVRWTSISSTPPPARP